MKSYRKITLLRSLVFSALALVMTTATAHAAQSSAPSSGLGYSCPPGDTMCYCDPNASLDCEKMRRDACKDTTDHPCPAGSKECSCWAKPKIGDPPGNPLHGPIDGSVDAGPVVRPAEIRTGAGLCLDVHAPEVGTNGGRVQAWACHGQPQQRWRYDRAASALSVASGLCLDVRAGINQNGNSVQVWTCNGAPQQQWTPLKNGALRNAGGLCLDVHAADQVKNGARVQIWQCNGSQQQRFTSSAF